MAMSGRMMGGLLGGALLAVGLAQAQDDTFDEYRSMFGDDNPAIFIVDEGSELWTQARGPENVSLEQCDLGQGPGVVENVYGQLPRYFEDTNSVMDLEGRLIHCMVELQGFKRDEIIEGIYSGAGDNGTEMEALVAYVADASQGSKVAVPQSHPEEKAAYKAGEALFYHRAGPYDFSCATCHRQSDKRIRLQSLPNLTKAEGARATYTTWPAYRISQGVVRTMGWRMRNCARQQRLPELQPGSEAVVDLLMYMGVNAEGGSMDAPGLKR